MGTTQRYLMFVSYVGTGFWGSQLQNYKGCGHTYETVQYAFENGLREVFQLKEERPIRVILSSRTDKGVHALRAALQADLPQFKGYFLKPNNVKFKLNRFFKDYKNVRVLEVYSVPDSFNVFRAVLGKTYMYRCGLLKQEFFDGKKKRIVSPIMEIDRTYLAGSQSEFDLTKAQEAATLFEGQKDFGGILGRPTHNTKPTVCNIKSFKVELAQPNAPFDPLSQTFNFYNFTCHGDRFLYHMVRRMVSLTLSVGYNILSLNDIQKLFDKPVPSSWPRRIFDMVPGFGLYLVNVHIDLEKINQVDDATLGNKTEEIPLFRESE